MSRILTPKYGRMLDDFVEGDTYVHPWEVTLDDGMIAMFAASFLDATPVFASRQYALALGFRDRPISPLLLLNLGLSFSVHDVSEQAIAHLAYIDVRFPEPAYAGDTVTASSKVLSSKMSSTGDKGVVHVRTLLQNQHGRTVCAFERKALIRAGKVEGRPAAPKSRYEQPNLGEIPRLPPALREGKSVIVRAGGFASFYEDFQVGDIYAHGIGRTVGETEHQQLTMLVRNSHPLHFDAVYCRENSFTKNRVVYGGLVLCWVMSLTSRDLTGNALWDMGLDDGAHPNPTHAGDTLFAACRVEQKEDVGPGAGAITLRVVGVRNTHPAALLAEGKDLFAPEIKKGKEDKIKDKVVEITRTVLLLKRPL
ncbi:MAG: MaoC family dehydratase [Polyangiaceae bacterium]|jgi:2-methylfumaryl-CoA hydratase|nr:MaoC family dehydratase [Polyangiaceae bacterium]